MLTIVGRAMKIGIEWHFWFGFRDSSFRWIDIRLFHFDENESNHKIMDELISNKWYRTGYIGGPQFDDKYPVHGPYNLENINFNSYSKCTDMDAIKSINTFCCLYKSPPSENVFSDINSTVIRRFKEATDIYRLKKNKKNEIEVNVLEEYREYIAINKNFNELALVVAAID